jgi:predicted nucleic acid-binding protein
MTRLLLDTSAYIALIEEADLNTSALEAAEKVYLSVIALGELQTGMMAGARAQLRQAALDRFLRDADVDVLPVIEAIAISYAMLFSDVRQRGRMLPTNDLWIAATALAHDLTLLTADRHFTELPIECWLLE